MVNKRVINKEDINSMHVDVYYYLILLAIMLQSVAYIPFVIEIYKTNITNNIPYITLFFQLFAFLIFLSVSAIKKYYLQLFFFIIFIVTCLYVIFLKVKLENEKFTNINTYTPSNSLNMSYRQFYNKAMCQGMNDLSPAGKTINWNNSNFKDTDKCIFNEEDS